MTGFFDSRSLRRTIGLIAASLAVVGVRLLVQRTPSDLAGPAWQFVDVTMDMKGFDRDEIQVRAGDPVTIRFANTALPYRLDGGGTHQLAIDEFGVDIRAEAEDTASATFVPTRPGTYTFYCDVCCGGRANPTMVGTLVVES